MPSAGTSVSMLRVRPCAVTCFSDSRGFRQAALIGEGGQEFGRRRKPRWHRATAGYDYDFVCGARFGAASEPCSNTVTHSLVHAHIASVGPSRTREIFSAGGLGRRPRAAAVRVRTVTTRVDRAPRTATHRGGRLGRRHCPPTCASCNPPGRPSTVTIARTYVAGRQLTAQSCNSARPG